MLKNKLFINHSFPAFFSILFFISCLSPQRGDQVNRPNILFIAVDDLRPELGCYGNPIILSPNIDKMASQGTVFSRAYCNVAVCGASRASLLTGTRPTDYRFLNFRSRADIDHPEALVLPALFKENGYYTISLGKIFHFQDDSKHSWNINWRPSGPGRNYLLESNIAMDKDIRSAGMPYENVDVADSTYFDGQIARKAIGYLKNFEKSDSSFFLAVGFAKPHLPFNAPKRYWDLYDPEEIGLAPNPFPPIGAPVEAFHPWKELRSYYSVPKTDSLTDELALKLRHAYYACISYVDAQIGLLLDELDRSGLSNNTIIVLWGDHGWNLGENGLWGKHCNFNRSLNAPLIFKVPGLTDGKTNESITEFIDIYPTLVELAGLRKPKHLDGESLVSRIKGLGQTEDDFALCKWGNGLTYIENNYFYTEWYDKDDRFITNMLYDHTIDPDENKNISGQSNYTHLIEDFTKQIRDKRGVDFFKKDSK